MEVSSQLEAVYDLAPVLNSIVQEFEGLVKQLWAFALHNPQAQFHQIEERARQLSKECFASALQSAVQLHRGSIEEGWLLGDNHCECGSGGIVRYKGSQKRTLQTWVGAVTVERGYFYCKGCGTGRYPLDEGLGMQKGEHFSDGVQQGVCLLGVQMPFDRASEAMQVLSGISVSPREVERITEERGLLLESNLHKEEELLLSNQPDQQDHPNSTTTDTPGTGVWAVTLDAGKVRYQDGWHDAKAGLEWCSGQSRCSMNKGS